MLVNWKDFDISKLNFTLLDNHNYNFKCSYPIYNGSKLLQFTTPFIILTDNNPLIYISYGNKMYPQYIKINYNNNHNGCQNFFNLIKQIENRMHTQYTINQIFGKYSNVVKNSSLTNIKYKSQIINDDGTKYSKMIINTNSTQIYCRKMFNHENTKIDGDDISGYIKRNCYIRMIINFDWIWFKYNKNHRNKMSIQYGIAISIEHMEIILPITNNNDLMQKCFECIMFNQNLFNKHQLKKMLNRDIRKYLI